jgi:hypothetical protein
VRDGDALLCRGRGTEGQLGDGRDETSRAFVDVVIR